MKKNLFKLMAEIARKKGIIWKPSTEAGVCPGRFQVA